MKIRTDFVTNSSSSSYAVEISISTIDGKKYDYETGADEDTRACLNCSADDILKTKSVIELMQLITGSLSFPEEDEEGWEDEEEREEYFSEDMIDFINEAHEGIEKFQDRVIENVSDLSQISSIKLRGIWSAWGEGASGYWFDLEALDKELLQLAKDVIEAEDKKKEEAKRKLAEYLSNYTLGIRKERWKVFPTKFLGSPVSTTIIWERYCDSIEELAQRIVDENMPSFDLGVETTEIDMQNRTYIQKAEYYVDEDEKLLSMEV